MSAGRWLAGALGVVGKKAAMAAVGKAHKTMRGANKHYCPHHPNGKHHMRNHEVKDATGKVVGHIMWCGSKDGDDGCGYTPNRLH